MARKRRGLTPFSLSFLDIMSCGFGAAVLLFLIIKHNVAAHVPAPDATPDLTAEVNLLETEVLEGKKGLAELRNTVSEVDQQIVVAEGLARRITEQVREAEGETEAIAAASVDDEIEEMRTRISQLESRRKELEAEKEKSGEDARTFRGEGSRQYLTGLQIGGKRILVLLDTSASMLDKTIVNVIRRRNMSADVKRRAAKWQQARRTVDWLSARFPVSSHYQIYTFNTEVEAALPGTMGEWLEVRDVTRLDEAVERLKEIVPEGGTSLAKAFAAVRALRPQPDNIYLITDGLPTQGMKPPVFGSKVSGKKRLDLFDDALQQLPSGTPVNVILSPMEGDPMAAFSFWGLAVQTRGSFLSPAEDWP